MGVIAYMVTWTTYGSWLQGDRRGWVKDGKTYNGNVTLKEVNRRQMKAEAIVLTKDQKALAKQAIIDKAEELKQKILALMVCSNQVHVVAGNINLPIGRVVSHYKHAVRLALQRNGFEGKLWTRGFDKRYCMNKEELNAKIAYVRNHN